MTARAFMPTSLDQMPGDLPIFPLTGALLLPVGHLPLNIFEPRYLTMISDALQTPQRLIGMTQATDLAVSMGEAPVHALGCAGRITAFSENDDGTMLITLTGIIRFAIQEELDLAPGGYRRVVPDFSAFASDLAELSDGAGDADVLRASVIDATKRYFEAKGFNTDWDGIQSLDLCELVTSLGMACPFDPLEKQALLEAANVEERAKTLTQIMTMATLGDSIDANAAVN